MSRVIELSGKTALITGASQGIGAEMARVFHEAGATVLINHPNLGDSRCDAEHVAAELNALRASSAFVTPANVADAASVQVMMEEIRKSHGGIDFLVNNAGIIRDRTIAKMTLDEWQNVIDVNLSGVFHCCKYGLEIMRDGGAIVNMSSIAAIVGFFGQTNYAAAKAGVSAMTRVLAKECARRDIRVNAIAPGVVDTTMAATIPPAVRDDMLANIPLGRLGRPREIADVALFLCSPMASYVSGQTIEVNGGWHG